MASIALEFIAPDMPDLAELQIYESANQSGPYTLIETVTSIGSFGNYIENYTSTFATSLDNWFMIQWQDSKGAQSKQSTPIKGKTQLLIGRIVDRVLQRNVALSPQVVAQEAEAAIEVFFGADPYTVDDDNLATGRKYQIINGLTYMVLARTMLVRLIQTGSLQSATLGLVSFKNISGQQKLDIQELVDLANKELGIDQSVVIDMERICKVYGGKSWANHFNFLDQEFQIMHWVPLQVERP